MTTPALKSLISYTARVVVVSYVCAVLLELIFPGMVSTVINLDLFLWAAILLALFSYVLRRR